MRTTYARGVRTHNNVLWRLSESQARDGTWYANVNALRPMRTLDGCENLIVVSLQNSSRIVTDSQVCFSGGVGYFLERTRILRGIQCTTHFIDFFVVETKRFIGSSGKWSWRGKPAASARAGLRKAWTNAERWKIIFPSEFAICSGCQNVEETEI